MRNGSRFSIEMRCNGLRGATNKEEFNYNGQSVSVEDYYDLRYKVVLKYPDDPVMIVGKPEQNVMVPMEAHGGKQVFNFFPPGLPF